MESDDCRTARLITEMFWADLMSRSLRADLEKLTDAQREEIQHGWYLKALEIVRANMGSGQPESAE